MGKEHITYQNGEIGEVNVAEDFLLVPDALSPDANAIYKLPPFLNGRVTAHAYSRWLQRKAATHCKRDRKRHPNRPISPAGYKSQIHEAVNRSDGLDWYTGESLCWEKISTYDNDDSKAGRSHYKADYAFLPTVDHVATEDRYEFVICGWRTNDAKNDLALETFVDLCRRVVERHGSK